MSGLSPDDYMFRQFDRHSRLLRGGAGRDHAFLSSGVNHFPASRVWKDLARDELEGDLALGYYTAMEGVPTLRQGIATWANLLASRGFAARRRPLGGDVQMTIGSSQAAAAVFDYAARARGARSVLLPGHNYSLFDRLARRHGLRVIEMIGDDEDPPRSLPAAEALADRVEADRPDLLVLVVPSNPSGESYSGAELRRVLEAAWRAGSLVLIDQVGQLPMAQAERSCEEEEVVRLGMREDVAFISSFSKADAVPGFRLGYLLGPRAMTQHAAELQMQGMTFPPNFPVLPAYFAMVCRCVHVGRQEGWLGDRDRERLLTFARRVFGVTTAVAPGPFLDSARRRLSGEEFERGFGRYRDDQQAVGRAIRDNEGYLFDRLGPYLSARTARHSGFNLLIELEPFRGRDEHEVSHRLLDEAGVTVLSEACFRVTPRRRPNFWLRVSLCSPTDPFRLGVDRLRSFIERTRYA